MSIINKYTKLFIYSAGIFLCYLYFGMLHEKIICEQYGNGEKFTYTFTFVLVYVQCSLNCIFAKIGLLTVMKQGKDTTAIIYYFLSALTYFLAMVCSNMALQYVNYPTQVIGKASKPIPVMILGVLLGKRIYPIRKYIFIFLIVIGVALFMYKGNVSKKQIETALPVGELLLLLALTMDGLLSAVQERMRAEYHSKSGHMMLNMNMWTVVFSGIVILVSGELFELMHFLQKYPWKIMTFATVGAFGQYFIFLTVADFGPLPCSIITTTRKFFTILISVLYFGNTLSLIQWISTFIVFSGLFFDAVYG